MATKHESANLRAVVPLESRTILTTDLGAAPLKHERFSERIYENLFHSIVTGHIAAGAKLPSEVDLSKFFGVSRPVVRQALDRLRSDGLVSSLRGSGTYVRLLKENAQPHSARSVADLSHIQHGIELRLVIEPESAALASVRRKTKDLSNMRAMLEQYSDAVGRGDVAHHFDFGFHEAIAVATGNPRLHEMVRTFEYDVGHAINLWRHLAQATPWTRTHDVEEEHAQILRFIEAQDPEGAKRAMRAHIENARIRMLGGAD